MNKLIRRVLGVLNRKDSEWLNMKALLSRGDRSELKLRIVSLLRNVF